MNKANQSKSKDKKYQENIDTNMSYCASPEKHIVERVLFEGTLFLQHIMI